MGKSRSKKSGRRPDKNIEAAILSPADEGHKIESIEKPKPNFTWEQLDAIRDEAGVGKVDDEGFTVQEYAEHYSLPYQTAAGQLRRMAKIGKLIQGWKHIVDSSGANRRMACFRQLEGK